MAKPQPADLPLYERDFYAWTQDQAAKLRARAHNSIDWDNAAEELESLGDSQRNEIESRMNVLLVHLLKWRYQPDRRSGSWKGSIVEQRNRLQRRIAKSPSLKAYPAEVLGDEYALARTLAAAETELPEDVFPHECPFTLEDILDPAFYPDGE
ncbi:DUF29 domain-containing protein [Aureimonas sp. Leaf324]|jgi:hypothetical protein|uniref:DUF29 domain-containing protein n=1 Tax=Aureimonas sp. Leaf324 TaxID=1736336 RepID=UPI0006F25C69|nr:DUF29 domain-containing protein [Aureimonas sp. Leaf324]KQQ88724.1 hypothetical protein ASF65_18090 [Aureimonas sp. Leaf324]